MKGATPGFRVPVYSGSVISIHAPVKGATCNDVDVCGRISDFNPRTREGCDLCKRCGFFNHSNFNPRTREGCDTVRPLFACLVSCISIHAPVKGATPRQTYAATSATISIHAPAKGATTQARFVAAFKASFQSTHPRRVRRRPLLTKKLVLCQV